MIGKILRTLVFSSGAMLLAVALVSCKNSNSMSKTVPTVQIFQVDNYLGTWYEVARLDFKFEKDLKNVTAQYSKREDGKIKVVNKGYDFVKNEWKEAVGKAKFNGPTTQGALKVSFFGPFYSEYNVVMMDPDYKTALVFGESTKYLWILSREKTISEQTKEKYLSFAQKHGYKTQDLVWTVQD